MAEDIIKILTWNVNHLRSKKSWPFAMAQFDANIYFFQETFHPLTYLNYTEYDAMKDSCIWEPTINGWGNMTVAKGYKIEQILLPHSFKGRLLIGIIQAKGLGEIKLVNLHTPIKGGYSRYNLQKMFSDVEPIIKEGKAVIAGDLNFGECFDKPGEQDHLNIMNNILTKYGLVDCHKLFNGEIEKTFRPPRNQDSLICIDYIFTTKDLSSNLKACRVQSTKEILKLSDHNPIVAVLAA